MMILRYYLPFANEGKMGGKADWGGVVSKLGFLFWTLHWRCQVKMIPHEGRDNHLELRVEVQAGHTYL